jgi:hypothetical protein
MKNYSDLTDIDTRLAVTIELEPVGTPTATVIINDKQYTYSKIMSQIIINDYLPLMDSINISVVLMNKHYTTDYETAVIIRRISIDNIDLIPKYDYLAEYINDHDNNSPTSYLGFNGKWTLTINRPFYHWLHEYSGQGWLFG